MADMIQSEDATSAVHLQERVRELEKRQQRQQRLLTFCLAGLIVVLLLNLIPGLGGIFAAILFSLGGIFIVLMIISITMGVLERFSPSGRIPSADDAAEQP
jgi:uncharacterized protein involved in cysteine biosynthesis